MLRELEKRADGRFYFRGDFLYNKPFNQIKPVGDLREVTCLLSVGDGLRTNRGQKVVGSAPAGANCFHDEGERGKSSSLEFVCMIRYYHVNEEELAAAEKAESEAARNYYGVE